MNKIRKWLIHKLGGFSELPQSKPNIVQKVCKIESIDAVHILSRDEYEYFKNICKDVIAKEIAEELLEKGLIDIRKLNTTDGNIEIRAKVYAVRGEQE